MPRPHFGHTPVIVGFLMLFFGGLIVYADYVDFDWLGLGQQNSTTTVVSAIIAFVGGIIFLKGVQVNLSNWYWWGRR